MLNYRKILKEYNLSYTKQRLRILSILENSGHALTEKEIEFQIDGACNKTTIYRNLTSLAEKKILHRIISDEAVRYKFIDKSSDQYQDHVHFQCKECSITYCLDGIPVQKYSLPDGFKVIENQFLILGICKNCMYGSGKNIQ
jgi:Fur family transcriptional regulator, ferric uptake regulator